jgi:uncharacterized membrane protein YoaK (UPF0700 family)
MLGLVAGFGDAVGFLVLFGVFTAHMSGNTTHFGDSLAEGEWTDAVVRLFPIPMFVVAIALGSVAVEVARRRGAARARLAPLFLVEAACLVVFMVLAAWVLDTDRLQTANGWYFVLTGLLTLAMGAQTAVLRRVGGLTVHTTYISGMLTQVAVGAVSWVFDRRDGRAVSGDPDSAAAHTWLALGVWACFASGAALGALVHRAVDEWALALPILALLVLAGASRSLTRDLDRG